MNVYYRQTVVGWRNVYSAGADDQFVNLNSEDFHALLLHVCQRAFAGCEEIEMKTAQELFDKEVRGKRAPIKAPVLSRFFFSPKDFV